ncbi:MAG: glutamate--cysteine ligase [Aeromicrobium erythreum]
MSRTVGVEEEMFLVDPPTLRTRDVSERVVRAARESDDPAPDEVTQELFLAQLETNVEPSRTLAGLREHLVRARRRAARAAETADVALLASATAIGPPPRVVTPTDRYQAMARLHPDVPERAAVCAMHVHVEVVDEAEAVRVVDALAPWLPVVTALAAGSPFSEGRDTGYATWRGRCWDRWPSAGPTEPFGDAAGYHRAVDALVASGAVLDDAMVYLDARPGREVPTVEVRVTDVLTEVDDAVGVAALVRALVSWAARDPAPPRHRVDVLRAGRWLAQRHGLGHRLLDPRTARAVPARDAVAVLLDAVRPDLEEADDLPTVHDAVERLLDEGGPAGRARTVAAGDPVRWARHVLEHTVPAP